MNRPDPMPQIPANLQNAAALILAALCDAAAGDKIVQFQQIIHVDGGPGKVLRLVIFDDQPHQLTSEQIKWKFDNLQPVRGKDAGFHYVSEGKRVIIVPDQMTISAAPYAPFGTPPTHCSN